MTPVPTKHHCRITLDLNYDSSIDISSIDPEYLKIYILQQFYKQYLWNINTPIGYISPSTIGMIKINGISMETPVNNDDTNKKRKKKFI